jgi:cytidyltransferase-like protein
MTNKKNGYIDMVGDLLHFGHVNQIKRAYDLGYRVIIGIHSDETVESYKRKPITTMDCLIQVIQSCKYISLIVPNAPLIITKEYLDKYNIDIILIWYFMVIHQKKILYIIKYMKYH